MLRHNAIKRVAVAPRHWFPADIQASSVEVSGASALFVLRCVFWLSVVYASMFRRGGFQMRQAPEPAAAMGGGAARTLVGQVGSRIAGFCADKIESCTHDAARLNHLVQSALADH